MRYKNTRGYKLPREYNQNKETSQLLYLQEKERLNMIVSLTLLLQPPCQLYNSYC